MQLDPVLAAVRAQLGTHAGIAVADPQIEAAAAHLTVALEPALRQALIQVAQQAAAEVDAQLPGHGVVVVLDGDDVELRVAEHDQASAAPTDEELDARITLRLPPSLKQAIEHVATIDGESVNAWVVDALAKRTHRAASSGRRLTEDFDL